MGQDPLPSHMQFAVVLSPHSPTSPASAPSAAIVPRKTSFYSPS